MAKVKKRKANKDYPKEEIKKGDTYYTWQLYKRPLQRSATPPRRSQLTGSSFLQSVYDLVDVTLPSCEEPSDFNNLADEVRNLGTDCESSLENMPEQLKEGDTGQTLQTRIEGCNEWADAIEQAASTFEEELSDIDGDDDLDEDEKVEKRAEAKMNCISDCESSEPDWG